MRLARWASAACRCCWQCSPSGTDRTLAIVTSRCASPRSAFSRMSRTSVSEPRPRGTQRTKVCRYNWHSASSPSRPCPLLKYWYIFQIEYTEAILSNSTREMLWFEITKMLIAVLEKKFIVSFIVIFGTLSFPVCSCCGHTSKKAVLV